PGAGKQLVIFELPDGVPIEGVTYRYSITYRRPAPAGDPGPTTFKALMTGRIRINNKSYYPPAFPCTTDLASLPSITMPRAGRLMDLTIPSGLPTCTSATEYRYVRPPRVCDLDNDLDVDQSDLAVIAARDGLAATAGDPRDVNSDGTIDAADVS